MPIYEYQCTKCGEKTEEIITTSNVAAPVHCGEVMQRLASASSFAFRTKGGNLVGFSGSHGSAKGNKRPREIGRGHGVGGRRKPPTMGGKKYN